VKIAITAKAVLDDRFGKLTKGQIVDMIDHKAMFYVARGDAELYETKIAREVPMSAVGATERLSASPAAQASPTQTLSESDYGVIRRRGRKPKEA